MGGYENRTITQLLRKTLASSLVKVYQLHFMHPLRRRYVFGITMSVRRLFKQEFKNATTNFGEWFLLLMSASFRLYFLFELFKKIIHTKSAIFCFINNI